MANFMILTGIGPTKHFFGCLPVRVGVFFCALFVIGILLGDLFEHQRVFEEQSGLVNRWITFSVQVVVALILIVNVIVKHQVLGLLTYFLMMALTVATVCEKLTKIIMIAKVKMLSEDIYISTLTKFKMQRIDLFFIYICRAFSEFIVLYYSTYICYSYQQESSVTVKDKSLMS